MYFSASSYMGFACVVWLHPQFLIKPGFWAYPAMTAAYVSLNSLFKINTILIYL